MSFRHQNKKSLKGTVTQLTCFTEVDLFNAQKRGHIKNDIMFSGKYLNPLWPSLQYIDIEVLEYDI